MEILRAVWDYCNNSQEGRLYLLQAPEEDGSERLVPFALVHACSHQQLCEMIVARKIMDVHEAYVSAVPQSGCLYWYPESKSFGPHWFCANGAITRLDRQGAVKLIPKGFRFICTFDDHGVMQWRRIYWTGEVEIEEKRKVLSEMSELDRKIQERMR